MTGGSFTACVRSNFTSSWRSWAKMNLGTWFSRFFFYKTLLSLLNLRTSQKVWGHSNLKAFSSFSIFYFLLFLPSTEEKFKRSEHVAFYRCDHLCHVFRCCVCSCCSSGITPVRLVYYLFFQGDSPRAPTCSIEPFWTPWCSQRTGLG